MAQVEAFEAEKCRKRLGLVGAFMLFGVLMALMCLALVAWSDEPLFMKVTMAIFGLFMLLLTLVFYIGTVNTTLYVYDNGLAIRFGKDPIKLIRWDNVAKASERYPSPGVTTLCFRLKAYGPWLAQFSEPELRRFLSRGALIYALLGWGYIDRKLGGNEGIEAEIAAMPPKSLQRKLAQRMFHVRKEQGVDLIYSSALCIRQDLEKIEASYVEWVARHPTTHN